MYDNKFHYIGTYSMCVDQQTGFFTPPRQHCIYELDISHMKILSALDYMVINRSTDVLYRDAGQKGDLFFFIPFHAKHIMILHKGTRQINYIPLLSKKSDFSNLKFQKHLFFGEKLYLMPIGCNGFIELDLKYYIYKYHEVPGKNKKDAITDWCIYKDELCLVIKNLPYLIYLNPRQGEKTAVVKMPLIEIVNLFTVDDIMWVLGKREQYFVMLIYKNGTIVNEIKLIPTQKTNYFFDPVITDDSIYLFPKIGKCVYRINKYSLEIFKCEDLNHIFSNKNMTGCPWDITFVKYIKNDTILINTGYDFLWYKYQLNTKTLTSHNLTLSPNDIHALSRYKLEYFINEKKCVYGLYKNNGNCGTDIYRTLNHYL